MNGSRPPLALEAFARALRGPSKHIHRRRHRSDVSRDAAAASTSTSDLLRSSTIYSPNPDILSSHLSNTRADDLTLYTLCTSLPSLPALLPPLQALPNSVGSFAHAPPGSPSFFSIAHFSPHSRHGHVTPDAARVGRVWKTEMSGRRAVEVGRWHRPHTRVEREDLKGDTVGELARLGLSTRGGRAGMDASTMQDWGEVWEPEIEVGRIDALEGIDAETLLILSDGAPRPVLRALDSMFPSATKAGLVTAGTPFITGRPHTLLVNGEVLVEGSVGLALPYKLEGRVDFNLEAISEVMRVERSQGNMLLSLDGFPNPTQTLIQAIQRRGGQGLTKEEDFYLGLLGPDGSASEAVRILSGDPSRGALSLEMENSLLSGQPVQFMQRHRDAPLVPLSPSSLTFGALSRSETEDDHPTGASRVEEGFIGFSEAGFIYSAFGGGKSKTAVGTSAGGFARLAKAG